MPTPHREIDTRSGELIHLCKKEVPSHFDMFRIFNSLLNQLWPENTSKKPRRLDFRSLAPSSISPKPRWAAAASDAGIHLSHLQLGVVSYLQLGSKFKTPEAAAGSKA